MIYYMLKNYSISFNLVPLQIHPEQARASRDLRGYVTSLTFEVYLQNRAVFVGSFLSQTWLGYDRKEELAVSKCFLTVAMGYLHKG